MPSHGKGSASSEQRDARAQNNLGLMFRKGWGLAASEMTPDQIAEAQRMDGEASAVMGGGLLPLAPGAALWHVGPHLDSAKQDRIYESFGDCTFRSRSADGLHHSGKDRDRNARWCV